MIFLIPDYHTEKTLSKQFQLWFPAHHKKLVKLNENQSFITKKFRNYISGKKLPKNVVISMRHHGLSEWHHRCNTKTPSGWSSENHWGISITQNFQIWFFYLPDAYKIRIGEVENSNFSQRGVVLKAWLSPGRSPGWIQPGYWGKV